MKTHMSDRIKTLKTADDFFADGYIERVIDKAISRCDCLAGDLCFSVALRASIDGRATKDQQRVISLFATKTVMERAGYTPEEVQRMREIQQ